MITQTIELYTDGSSLHNPGSSGLAYVIRYFEATDDSPIPEAKTIEGKQGYRLSTNSRMELMAFIYGMNAILDEATEDGLFKSVKQVNVASDSEYLVNGINQNWAAKWIKNNWMTAAFNGKASKPVRNKDLWEQILAIQNKARNAGINLILSHVDGHSGHEFNEMCDKMAKAAASSSDVLIDKAYEDTVAKR